jgi:MYXO-CTERM domain-containing protein
MDYVDVVPPEALTELGGRFAWGGTSSGYPGFHTSTIDFGTALAGQTIRLRFRQVTAGFFAGTGWELDDIALSGLSALPFPTVGDDAGVCLPGQRPLAFAGDDQTVTAGDTVFLDGSTSLDPDGSAVTFAWTQASGPVVTIADALGANPSFVAPDLGSPRVVTLRLVVKDEDDRASAPDLVAITVNPVPQPDAGVDAMPDAGEDDVDAATGSGDPDGGGNPGTPDAGGGGEGGGGCGCRSGGDPSGAALLLIGAAAIVLRRRRG